jgi:hypothetical protein
MSKKLMQIVNLTKNGKTRTFFFDSPYDIYPEIKTSKQKIIEFYKSYCEDENRPMTWDEILYHFEEDYNTLDEVKIETIDVNLDEIKWNKK